MSKRPLEYDWPWISLKSNSQVWGRPSPCRLQACFLLADFRVFVMVEVVQFIDHVIVCNVKRIIVQILKITDVTPNSTIYNNFSSCNLSSSIFTVVFYPCLPHRTPWTNKGPYAFLTLKEQEGALISIWWQVEEGQLILAVRAALATCRCFLSPNTWRCGWLFSFDEE